jgi:hypothetical protein
MTEFARGGYVDKDSQVYTPNAGCNGIGYVIPIGLLKKYRALLDKLNEEAYTDVEVVDETTAGQEDL